MRNLDFGHWFEMRKFNLCGIAGKARILYKNACQNEAFITFHSSVPKVVGEYEEDLDDD